MIKIIAPTHILIPRKTKPPKKFSLNLNTYRNAYHYELSKVKVLFSELIQEQLINIPKMGKIHIHYTFYAGSKTKSDLMNWIAVIDKFFQDTLVVEGIIEDDNFTFVPFVTCGFGGIDPKNQRVEITLKDYNDAINTR